MVDVNKYFMELSKKFDKNYFDFLILISKNKNYSYENVQLILKAYRVANGLHANQKRKSGEAYISHPLNVAYVLAQAGFDYETVCAALLHDTVEDTNYTLNDIEENFGKNVAILVDGVTKMKKSNFANKKEQKSATHEKILECTTKDARIIAIKLVDRLHNMFTLGALPPDKQIEIATETDEFYVNLARILGIYQIKDELQDLSLFYLNPGEFIKYNEIRNKIKREHIDECRYIGNRTKEILKDMNVDMEYNFKVKNVGAIYGEEKKGIGVYDIHDLVAIRMIVSKIDECYEALSVLKRICSIIDGSENDLIKNPKYNGYRSLNVNVNTYKDSQMQVRIRTYEMQKANELGFVSNWSVDSQKILTKKCSKLFKANQEEIRIKKDVFKI